MQRNAFTLLAIWFLLLSSLQVEAGLNPFSWFAGDDEEDVIALKIASPADEAAAASLLETGMAKLEDGNTGSANRTFKKIIKKYSTAKAAADARYYRGQILTTKGKWVKAFASFQEVISKHPNYESFDQVIGAQFECATALMEGARGRILWIIPGFRQYGEATREFEQIVRNAPYSDYAPLSLMNIAIVSEMQEKPEDAIDALDRLINYYPQSMLAPDAYYNMAETYSNLVKGAQYDQGSTRQAISYYEDFLILFPKSNYLGEVESNLAAMEDLLARSRLSLGDFFYNFRSNNTAALVFYNETITIAPESEAAAEARLRIADIEAGVKPTSGASILRKILTD
ncbi:outer membrane protein assembly factor BamD [Coraliomargarita algicola]|uniref:Outer membrane protein assembly factor BamD n=1 Tax=Coraliomargarita algicola TaxID=3092156 RepID=A0ABZ0RQW0_9BACT|nr:outer membrane protein assembly factor BamD [Coraliomargarita sp. J2-16]WPJ97629.1 outer membrane protein assembly factor BamD [Coraliomargarita sp. J2-16]